MYASKSTYVIFFSMIVFSAAIVWIYYTVPVTNYTPPFERNTALHPINESNLVKVFYVLLNDNGVRGRAIGCGDSIVAVEREIPATTTPLAAAFLYLLSDKNKTATTTDDIELSNTLHSSSLKLAGINLKDGVADIKLSGKVSLGGECDNPRVEAQLEETARQFSSVKKVNISINDKPLSEVMSLK